MHVGARSCAVGTACRASVLDLLRTDGGLYPTVDAWQRLCQLRTAFKVLFPPSPAVDAVSHQGVGCPAVDFRQEQDPSTVPPGTATLSAGFFLPRSANILRILGAMASGDQVKIIV